jgi:hypothetical protein
MTISIQLPATGDSPDERRDRSLSALDIDEFGDDGDLDLSAVDLSAVDLSDVGALPVVSEPAGFTLARLTVVLVVAIIAARLGGMSVAVGWTLLTVVTIWAVALAASSWTVIFAAVETWLLGTGFLVDRFGVLSFGPDDRLRLAVTVVAGCLAVLVTRIATRKRAPLPQS